jgi:hypothetical protein
VARVALSLGEDPLGRVVGMTLRRPLAQLTPVLPGKLGRRCLAVEVGCLGIAVGPGGLRMHVRITATGRGPSAKKGFELGIIGPGR